MGVERNPKDSMKSTWRTADKSTWTFHHHLYEILNVLPTDPKRPIPVHEKTDKVPHISQWQQHKWILLHAIWPVALHQLYFYYFKTNLHPIVAVIYYSLAFKANAIHELALLRNLGHTYGFLDGDKHARDEIPDISVKKVFRSLSATSTVRPMMTIFIAYRRSQGPALSWWLPLEIGLYGIVLDFWFYWYHRVMHESEFLWKFHRTHHLTKHPNPLLSLYADTEQEIFDIAVIPFLAYATLKVVGLPMGFCDWWVCHQYIVFTELFGHSGVRIFSTPASTLSWFLEIFDAQLTTEDHDLHHRKGWKNSANYGKQTRLWDKLFGTCFDRIEAAKENVDWQRPITVDLIWATGDVKA